MEDEKGNLSLEENITPESTVKGTSNNSATYALNLVSSGTEMTNAKVTLNNGTLTIVGNEKTTEDITLTIKYANTENVEDVKLTKIIKIKITKIVIKYGTGKTAETIAVGEDLTITINDVTESFRVLRKESSQIIAVPYYNITLDTENPVQSSSAGGTKFTNSSSDKYWTEKEDAIDWTDSRCLLKPYVEAYSTKLNTATGSTGKVTARLGKYSEMYASGVTNEMRNPGTSSTYWLGSASQYNGCVQVIGANGNSFSNAAWNFSYGVRPVVVISIS